MTELNGRDHVGGGAGTQGRFGLLDPQHDPGPVEIIEAQGREDVLLVCEHAGRAVPRGLDGLGLPQAEIDRHIGHDIGAETVARAMAARLGCALIVQRYSRLVIDCNRPVRTPQSIPEVSDGTVIPANSALPVDQADARIAEIFDPFAAACRARAAAPGLRAAFSIHSFEPALNGRPRPWHVGFLYASQASHGADLASSFRTAHPDLHVGDNEPYRIEPETDWFIPVCAEAHGLVNSLIEIRNDQIRTPERCARWAGDLAAALDRLVSGLPEATSGEHTR